jgi:hypothetical protein
MMKRLQGNDVGRSGFGVWRVAREVAETQRYELVAKNPNYFFRKKDDATTCF